MSRAGRKLNSRFIGRNRLLVFGKISQKNGGGKNCLSLFGRYFEAFLFVGADLRIRPCRVLPFVHLKKRIFNEHCAIKTNLPEELHEHQIHHPCQPEQGCSANRKKFRRSGRDKNPATDDKFAGRPFEAASRKYRCAGFVGNSACRRVVLFLLLRALSRSHFYWFSFIASPLQNS